MAAITLEGVHKSYGSVPVIHGVDIDIADGEFVVLVGPSGCGKSTLLRMVAGLEPITGGSLRIGGRVVNDLAPKDRDIAMVFQSYALYPHMTVAQNMGFSLKLRGTELQQAVSELALDLAGPASLAARAGDDSPQEGWARRAAPTYLNLRKASIYGGSNEIQRQIISRTILGL